ncbi:MAG: ABC transporter permease [Bacteroidia bacterium]|nr:MAG: ABC transporter permease [Bacteroidia bacterium]PIE86528.1 MAG: ABC transporter permease [Bacteroidia bacterium]
MKIFFHFGRYFLLLLRVFSKPEKSKLYLTQIVREIMKLGVNSLWIVAIISVFFGAVITLQTAYGMENPLIPRYLIGLGTRDSMLLEFSSTIVCLILAGKVGSSIASEIGTMRVTEQIDALEMMGVNSAAYLIFPKIIGMMLFMPVINIISMFLGIFGGWLFGLFSGVVTTSEYLQGIHYSYNSYYVLYSLIKSQVFAFIITSASSYYGYYTNGGALDVGKSSTVAVVNSSIWILSFNLILTNLLLV